MNAPSDDHEPHHLASDGDEPFPNLLPPDGMSPEEIEAEMPEGFAPRVLTLDDIQARLAANLPAEEPTQPRFLLSEVFAVTTAFAVGLGVGRIDQNGVFALGLGFVATLLMIQALLFRNTSRMWMSVAVCALALYIGAMLGSAFLLLGGADAEAR